MLDLSAQRPIAHELDPYAIRQLHLCKRFQEDRMTLALIQPRDTDDRRVLADGFWRLEKERAHSHADDSGLDRDRHCSRLQCATGPLADRDHRVRGCRKSGEARTVGRCELFGPMNGNTPPWPTQCATQQSYDGRRQPEMNVQNGHTAFFETKLKPARQRKVGDRAWHGTRQPQGRAKRLQESERSREYCPSGSGEK